MTRTEENDNVIVWAKSLVDAHANDDVTVEDMIALNMSVMMPILADISKSLAILADKEKKDEAD